jgi:modification methylase
MITKHEIIFKNSRKMSKLSSDSIDLAVTSPPYPMIEMWDDVLSRQSSAAGNALAQGNGPKAFELMHQVLDRVWDELLRVIRPGGIACINIGDAVRTINERFALYTNHARILTYMQKIGFSALPAILWRKQTNAPNKFMGSGMLPPGAYVTLEHEYILIFRKGDKREFLSEAQKQLRRESAYFWEERNTWFSDVWMDVKGSVQNLSGNKSRERSAAYPFELPYRLISMFSIKGDTILDPFLGIGTTMYAAMATGRNSVGYEIDPHLRAAMLTKPDDMVCFSNQRINQRLEKHVEFVEERTRLKGGLKHLNRHYLFPVVTNQERELLINAPEQIKPTDENRFEVIYADAPQEAFAGVFPVEKQSGPEENASPTPSKNKKGKKGPEQQQLF